MSRQLLKQRDFRLLILGKFVSMVGSNMQQFALSLYVFALTGSATIFATLLSISILPRLLLSPVAGVFGDWFDRKKMIVGLDLINAFVLMLFAVYFFQNQGLALWTVYVLVIVLELTEIFYESSSAGILPSILKQEDMLEAKSLQTLVMSIARLLSPMIAGIVYGVSGLLFVLILNAVSFLLSGISEMFIRVPARHKKPDKINLNAFFTDVKEGFSIIKNSQLISTIIALGTIVNFVIAPFFSVGFIVLIKQVLAASDVQFGIYQSVMAVSMMVAPILMTKYFKKFDVVKLCVVNFIIISMVIFGIALVPSPYVLGQFETSLVPYVLLMVLSFGIGVSVGLINIMVGTLFVQAVPVEAMGRTSTVMNLMITIFIPIGQLSFGFLFDTLNVSYVIMISGTIMLFTVLKYRKPLLAFSKSKTQEAPVYQGELAHES